MVVAREVIEFAVEGGEIELGALLKVCGAADTGGHAKMLVQQGSIRVNAEVCQQRHRKLHPGDVVDCDTEPPLRLRLVGSD